jgi:ParB/RepB/Spo0J family partition protein
MKETRNAVVSKALAKPWAGATTEVLPLAKLILWPGNPRRIRRGLRELGESMRRNGQLDPLIGRRSKEHADCVEVADGTRRRGAAELVGIAELRVEIRELTDREMIDVALEANGGRDDFHPLEEAEGYRRLVEDHNVPVAEVAAKHGIDERRVNGRLALCKLADPLAKAFEADRMTVGAAIQLARLSAIVQSKVWEELAKRQHNGSQVGESEVRGFLQRTIFLPIASAPFSLREKVLIPNAGSCDECPKRTNNQRHLFEAPKDEDDACTDSACWVAKRDAHVARLRKAAEERKQTILEGVKARAIFLQGAPEHLALDAGYIELDKPCGKLFDDKSEPRIFEKMVGAGAREHAILAIDPLGNPRKLVPIATVKRLLRESGHHEVAKRFAEPSEERQKEHASKERVKAEKEATKERRGAIEKIVPELEKAAASWAAVPDGFWQWLAKAAVRIAPNEVLTRAWKRRGGDGVEPRQVIEGQLIDKAKAEGDARALAIGILATRGAFSGSATDGGTELLDGALRVFSSTTLDDAVQALLHPAIAGEKPAKKGKKKAPKKVEKKAAKPKKSKPKKAPAKKAAKRKR